MGADQSELIDNQYLSKKLLNEIDDYSKSNIARDSLRYQLFLMAANIFIKNEQFFTSIDIHQIANYINDLGFININESKTIVQQIIQNSNCEEDATLKLQTILPKMRVKFNEKYISPSYSRELFNQIFSNSYETKWGIYSPTTVIDWKSTEIDKNYLIQSQDTYQIMIQNMPKITFYIKEKESNDNNNEKIKSLTLSFYHHEDLGSLIITNHVDKLVEMNKNGNIQGILPFKTRITKPINWMKNIHSAAFNGDESSVLYSLQLLPILINCPDINGNTPAHMAAMGDKPNMIKLLYSLGADFRIKNINGHLPHQTSNGKNAILTFISLGFDLNEKDSNGESILEIKTRDFNMNVIETLLRLNVNIFKPNINGTYWMQLAIHGEFYKQQNIDFISFQKRVRKIIGKNLNAYNEIENMNLIIEILNRNTSYCDEQDTIDINLSVTNRNIERIKVLLALGCHPDRIRDDGKTNLMLCAERNDFEIAEILVKNFCDPNFKNKKGENTFWVSSYLMNFNTASILSNNGVNRNELSSSGNTILHVAYNEKKMELFQFLLDSGCSPNVQNKDKETVLFQAFYEKNDEIAELLLKRYNGDINTQTNDGNSLAHIALFEHDYDRIFYYNEQGIDLEIKNNFGYTIFMISIIMLDDLEFSDSLLKHSADINTQDLYGNTPLLNILHSKKFDQNKFNFLIDNNCDINIQNSMGEFPLSVCMIKELNEVCQILLNKGCLINDPKSEYEPIAIALKIDSKYWFETLIEHGANALNEKYPIISTYIKSKFFDFELIKNIKGINASIGAPIQTALWKHYYEVALYLWDIIDEDKKADIAATPDSFGMIPLSAAIVYDCEKLVDILLSGDYEVMTPDSQNRTPFSYACQVNQIDWIDRIYKKITIENINLVDKIGNSAFTYLACSNNKEYCKLLFIKGANVFDINADHNKIIKAYQFLLIKYNEFIKISLFHYFQTQLHLDHWERVIDDLSNERNISRVGSGFSLLLNITNITHLLADFAKLCVEESESSSEKSEAIRRRNIAERINNKYKARFLRIKDFTRKDLLENFKLCSNLARHDNDFPFVQETEYHNYFDVDSFISTIFPIIENSENNETKE